MQGTMCEQIVKFAGCLISTQLWSAEADHNNSTSLHGDTVPETFYFPIWAVNRI